jgi:hypothetical protein
MIRKPPDLIQGGNLALAPGHVDALYNRGNTLCALDRHRDALADYDAVLWRCGPGTASALPRRLSAGGACRLRRGARR